MLRAILNKSWRQHPTRHQLYGHLPPITKTIQVRRTRHAGHCWRSRDELIRDVLLWTPTHGRAKARRLARTYIQQLCEDTGCCPEDLPRAMNNREEWRERGSGISVLPARHDDDDDDDRAPIHLALWPTKQRLVYVKNKTATLILFCLNFHKINPDLFLLDTPFTRINLKFEGMTVVQMFGLKKLRAISEEFF